MTLGLYMRDLLQTSDGQVIDVEIITDNAVVPTTRIPEELQNQVYPQHVEKCRWGINFNQSTSDSSLGIPKRHRSSPSNSEHDSTSYSNSTNVDSSLTMPRRSVEQPTPPQRLQQQQRQQQASPPPEQRPKPPVRTYSDVVKKASRLATPSVAVMSRSALLPPRRTPSSLAILDAKNGYRQAHVLPSRAASDNNIIRKPPTRSLSSSNGNSIQNGRNRAPPTRSNSSSLSRLRVPPQRNQSNSNKNKNKNGLMQPPRRIPSNNNLHQPQSQEWHKVGSNGKDLRGITPGMPKSLRKLPYELDDPSPI